MARAARRRAAILDTEVVDDSRLMRTHENGGAAGPVQHRVERLEPAMADAAATATPAPAPDAEKRKRRWTVAIAGSVLAAAVIYLASPPALAGPRVPGGQSVASLQHGSAPPT